MDKRTDINNASFAYGVNLLRMLLDMDLITENEYERITRISAEYAINGGNITINEAEADTVREIAEQYLSGKSLKVIAEMLTAKQIEYARPTDY